MHNWYGVCLAYFDFHCVLTKSKSWHPLFLPLFHNLCFFCLFSFCVPSFFIKYYWLGCLHPVTQRQRILLSCLSASSSTLQGWNSWDFVRVFCVLTSLCHNTAWWGWVKLRVAEREHEEKGTDEVSYPLVFISD